MRARTSWIGVRQSTETTSKPSWAIRSTWPVVPVEKMIDGTPVFRMAAAILARYGKLNSSRSSRASSPSQLSNTWAAWAPAPICSSIWTMAASVSFSKSACAVFGSE
jgi:hypothetical protein